MGGEKLRLRFNLGFQTLLTKDGNPSSEIQLFKLGSFVHWSGTEFTVDEFFMNSMIANFDAMKAEAKDPEHVIPIDFNHGSLEYGAEESKAGGWISELSKRDDGLYARVTWTKAAAEMIKEQEFRFISPEFATGASDEFGEDIEGAILYAAALTNRPFLKGMAPVTLNKGRRERESVSEGENTMKERLIQLFALAKDAGEDAIVLAAKGASASLEAIRTGLGLKEGDVTAAVLALKQERDKLTTSLKEATDEIVNIKAAAVEKEATAKVEAAVKEGKIPPKAKAEWLAIAKENPERFDKLVASQQIVPMGPVGGSGGNSDSTPDLHAAALKLSEERKISYVEALREIQKTNPELAKSHINRTGEHSHLS